MASGMSEEIRARAVHRIVRWIATRLFRFRIEVAGRERVPPGEPLIVAGGPHRNWIDGFLLLLALPASPRVIFLGSAGGLFNTWWKWAILSAAGGFAVVSDRGESNRAAIDAALAVLADGGRLGIFPEGWAHLEADPERVLPVQRGVAFIARESRRRTLPVAIAGAKPLWRGKTLRIRIGDSIPPPPPNASRAEQQAWAEGLRAALESMIPPQPPLPVDGDGPWPWLTTIFN